MPFNLGFGELLLIFGVLLLLFGAKRLPEVASGMGKGIRDFKRSLNGLDEASLQSPPPPPVVTAAPPARAIATPEEVKQQAEA